MEDGTAGGAGGRGRVKGGTVFKADVGLVERLSVSD